MGKRTFCWLGAIGGVMLMTAGTIAATTATTQPLKSPAAFSKITDRTLRSAAIFSEAARVLESPRCMNCHPKGRSPTQGEDLHPHTPFIFAGQEGHGNSALSCASCHQAFNVRTYGASVETMPGHAHWGLAPSSMAWQGLSRRELCEQIKDPARNGGRSLQQIHEHLAHDTLVGWAWTPGVGRISAPGTQDGFGRLIAAWIATGAGCPKS